jgi:CBS domain-containing protein
MEAVMKAIDVMVRDVITIGPDDSIADAAKLIADNDVSALPKASASVWMTKSP